MIDAHPQLMWWIARASGITATLMLLLSVVWGILIATRALRDIDRPAWMLEMHRWFSAIACTGIVIHLLALVGDNYVHFSWQELFVPGGSPWKTFAVTVGVVAFYITAAVQITSLFMRRLPRRVWKAIHYGAYASAWLGVVHAGLAGTDVSNRVYQVLAIGLTMLVVAGGMVRIMMGSTRRQRASSKRTAVAVIRERERERERERVSVPEAPST